MSYKGIDIRATQDRILFRASLKDSSGAKVTSGTTSLRLFEFQGDGTLKMFDFSTFLFVAHGSAVTTDNRAMTHRTTNADSYSTGIWTATLLASEGTGGIGLAGLTVGNLYIAQISNSGASPADQEREFQYGGEQGDALNILSVGTAQAGAASSITLAAGESAVDHILEGDEVEIIAGTGQYQTRMISAYVGSTKVATVSRAWTTQPDSTSVYAVRARDQLGVFKFTNGLGSYTPQQGLAALCDVAALGKTSGAGTTTFTARNKADTVNRIQTPCDGTGNRTGNTTLVTSDLP